MDIRCVCCSPETIEKKQLSRTYAIEASLPKRQKLCYDEYMTCSVCYSKVCFSCCEKLHPLIEKKRNLLSQRSLSFLNSMETFILSRDYDKECFIGHCCLIKTQRKLVRATVAEGNTEVTQSCSSSSSSSSSFTSIGGDLYLYEYNLLIDSPPIVHLMET
jgi:hypothetical protein